MTKWLRDILIKLHRIELNHTFLQYFDSIDLQTTSNDES